MEREPTYRRTDDAHRGLHVADLIALIVLIVGGINWGLVGLFEWDLVAAVFGFSEVLVRLIFILVGLAAIYCAVRAPSLAHLRAESPRAYPAT